MRSSDWCRSQWTRQPCTRLCGICRISWRKFPDLRMLKSRVDNFALHGGNYYRNLCSSVLDRIEFRCHCPSCNLATLPTPSPILLLPPSHLHSTPQTTPLHAPQSAATSSPPTYLVVQPRVNPPSPHKPNHNLSLLLHTPRAPHPQPRPSHLHHNSTPHSHPATTRP
jgi:hypothetical protein